MDPDRLGGIRPFVHMSADDRERVARLLDLTVVPAGQQIITQGERVAGLMIIIAGRAEVHRTVDGEDRDLAVLGPGAFVGERATLMPGAPASATVTALDDLVVAVPIPGHENDVLDDLVLGREIRAVAQRRRASNRVRELGPMRVRLRDGTALGLRPLWPDDWRLMAEGATRTSPESLHRRFFSVPKLTETTLRRMATVDYVDDFAWVALVAPPGHDAGLAVGGSRYSRLPEDRETAEVAFIITDDHQGRGIGPVLLLALAVAADLHEIRYFTATALATNTPVHRMLARAGAAWQTDPNDPTHVITTWSVADVLATIGVVADAAAMRALVRAALDDD